MEVAGQDDLLPPCEIHGDEVLRFYCRAHGVLGCYVCMMPHTACNRDSVETVSGQFLNSDEYLNVGRCLEDLKRRYLTNKEKIEKNISDVEIAYQSVINQVKALKAEVIDRLDDLEEELRVEAEDYKKINEDKMKSLDAELDALKTETLATDTLLRNFKEEGKYNTLFVEVKKAATIISEYHDRIYDISTRNCVNNITLYRTQAFDNILTKESIFGVIEMIDREAGQCSSKENLDMVQVGQINIKAGDDKNICHATGLTFLSPDYIAVADKANKNVKIVDVCHDQLISKISFTTSPCDIALIPPDQLAVTLRDEGKIQLLATTKGLQTTNQIRTDRHCSGIKYDQEKLIVAFDKPSPKVEILSLSGEILCNFQANLFTKPRCIGLSPNRCYTYVTDVGKMSITRFSYDGQTKNKSEGHGFMGVAVSNGGSVYACSKADNAVYKLPDDLSTVEPVLTTAQGIKAPIALVISDTRNMLYVSCGSGDAVFSNKLHVFKIKQDN